MHMEFCALFSGSSGNALYVATESTRLLVDAGVSGKAVLGALESLGVAPDSLDAVLVTHEHSDHVRGVGILSRKLGLPVYANAPTWAAMEGMLGRMDADHVRIFDEADFRIGDIVVQPFDIPHDAASPVGYRFHAGGRCIGVATDIGYMPPDLLEDLTGCDLLLLESNHDLDMLRHGPYPYPLKRRILGNSGHLSNMACGQTLIELVKRGLRHVQLGHLSGENNRPELALGTVGSVLQSAGIIAGQDVRVDMTWRDRTGTRVVL